MPFPSTGFARTFVGFYERKLQSPDGRLLPTPTLSVFHRLGNFFNFTVIDLTLSLQPSVLYRENGR